MTVDYEQRLRWARERLLRQRSASRKGPSQQDDLGVHLDEARVAVTIMPADPLNPLLDFDRELLEQVPDRTSGLFRNGVSTLNYEFSTSSTIGRFASSSNMGQPWRMFIAIRRNGGVEVGVGAVARYTLSRGGDVSGPDAYRLFVLVHAIRLAMQTQSRLVQGVSDRGVTTDTLGPFEMEVVLPDAANCTLSGLATGWEQAEHAFELPTCREPDAWARIEVDQWPAESGSEHDDLLIRMIERVANAFNDLDHRYLPPGSSGPIGAEYG